MSRSSNKRRRERSLPNADALHSDYVTQRRRQIAPQSLSRSQLQELQQMRLWASLIGAPVEFRPQPQAGRNLVRNEGKVFKAPQASRTSFKQHQAALDRINAQRGAIAGVERLKAKPVKVLDECVRRSERREVLMAKGKGGAKVARPIFTDRSKIRCK